MEVSSLLIGRDVQMESDDNEGRYQIDENITGKKPYVSIIIPTLNRYPCLKNTLESLLIQDYPNYEVIVIDSSDKSVASLLKEYNNENRIRYYWTDRKGPSAAKNEGIRQSQGDIIIFCDDDIVAKQNFISIHIENYVDPRVGGVGGRVITRKEMEPKLTKKVGKIRFDVSMIGNFNAVSKVEIDHVYGCNMSFRRDILIQTGGFDENFTGNAYFEETDLSIRVKKMGYKLIFEPNAVIIHVQPAEGGCRVNDFKTWMYWYYHNYAILLKKHYNKSRLPLFSVRQVFWVLVWTVVKKDFTLPKVAFRAFKNGWDGYPSAVI